MSQTKPSQSLTTQSPTLSPSEPELTPETMLWAKFLWCQQSDGQDDIL